MKKIVILVIKIKISMKKEIAKINLIIKIFIKN